MTAAHDYIASFLRPGSPTLEAIAAEEATRDDVQPGVGPEVARLLAFLVRLLRAERVLELGCSLGYSTVALAEALSATDGRLVSVERDPALAARARARLQEAGLADRVELIEDDLRAVLPALDGPFDLVLQDADKALYPEVLDRCVALLRPGGVYAADDALFRPLGVPARFADPVHAHNARVFTHPRLFTTLLPIGDGLTVSVKVA